MNYVHLGILLELEHHFCRNIGQHLNVFEMTQNLIHLFWRRFSRHHTWHSSSRRSQRDFNCSTRIIPDPEISMDQDMPSGPFFHDHLLKPVKWRQMADVLVEFAEVICV